jgi:glycogen operon protein
MLSFGVPMLLGGDELGRTQRGNNNGYCQDNEVSWVDWDLGEAGADLLEYTRRLLRLRRDHPVFRRRRFFQGRPIHGRPVDESGSGLADIGWFGPDGREMTERQWAESTVRALGMFLNGDEISEPGPRGQRIVDDSFLVLLNGPNVVEFRLPGKAWASAFELVLDTADDREGVVFPAGDEVGLVAYSLVVLRKIA